MQRAGGEPKAWEVRIKIVCTTLCHSDLTFWRMKDFPAVYPRIFGHEAFGLVESVGEKVEEFKAGDAVVPVFLVHCETRVDCKSTRSNMWSYFPFHVMPAMPRDNTSRFSDGAGQPIHNFLNVSSFCEYTVVDVLHVVKVDPAMPPQIACLLGCGVSTGVGAAWKVAEVERGSTVAIFGLGVVGLAVAEGARLCGATRIIGVDLNPEKFKLGKKFGLTDFLNPKDIGEKSVSQVIVDMTGGGADYCFECIGLASVMQSAYESARKGWGKTIILGVEMHGAPLSIDGYKILDGKWVTGSLFGGIKAKTDIPILVKKYMDKELHLDEFITNEVGFEEINNAFNLLMQGESLRCTIWMDK